MSAFMFSMILLAFAVLATPFCYCWYAVQYAKKVGPGSKSEFFCACTCFVTVAGLLGSFATLFEASLLATILGAVYIVLGICVFAWVNDKIDKLALQAGQTSGV